MQNFPIFHNFFVGLISLKTLSVADGKLTEGAKVQ